MIEKYILSVFFLGLSCPLSAQNRYDFAQFRSETGPFFRQPGKWTGKDWLTLGVIGAGTFEIHQYDRSIQAGALEHKKKHGKFCAAGGGTVGRLFCHSAPGGLFADARLAGRQRRHKKNGL